MTLLDPCIKPRGNRSAKLMIIGEAPGEQEELQGYPFVGPTGQLLTSLLREAGITPSEAYYTNVLYTRPPGNRLDEFQVAKRDLPPGYALPPMGSGAYLHPDLLPELDRLRGEIEGVQPNLLLGLGATAAWALTCSPKISTTRGTVSTARLAGGVEVPTKVLCTYHPAYLFQDWSKRVIVMADLIKAKHEMAFREIRRPEREIIINPSFQDVCITLPSLLSKPAITADVETKIGQITEVGFAWEPQSAIVIPFWDSKKSDNSYWPPDIEPWIWTYVKDLLTRHKCVIMQNGLYDVQYFWRMGIPVPGFTDDTMLLHHALYPELPKGLGFLGSVYTNEVAWKKLRARGEHFTKRDE